MSYIFYCYPRCSTCRKAQAQLDRQGVHYEYRDITQDTPSASELKAWHEHSGLPIRRFFNTSGMKYRELGLSKKLDSMTPEETYEILASDGMLIKRPLLVKDDDTVVIGYKEEIYEEL